ncbi:MAG: CopG family transcriptional regulator / antitoxin EndoAI [Bacillota bacterium]|nr:CopG family transcriptional regulator / antitoxin EndoAI [Bacillota bacterium]
MAQQVRRIMITLPDSLLQEVDGVAKQENRNRSEFIREAMRRYIEEKRRLELRERLKEGYRKMAGLNLELAGEAVAAENEALALYEEVLARGNGTEGA